MRRFTATRSRIVATVLAVFSAIALAMAIMHSEKPTLQKIEEVKPSSDTLVMEVTGYTSEPGQTDSSPCIAADNSDICKLKAKKELICASNQFPLGSLIHVDGLGTCTVRDHMNRRYTNNVDWYFGKDAKGKKDKKKLAIKIGRKDREVKVIRLGKKK